MQISRLHLLRKILTLVRFIRREIASKTERNRRTTIEELAQIEGSKIIDTPH